MNVSLLTSLVVTLLVASIPASEEINSYVNLTVEGGVSLVGTHCPGTLRLYCEGVDLTSVRWTFNGNIEIHTFFPIDMVTIRRPQHHYPLFLLVELVDIVQNTNPQFANFSSILIVDLLQLDEQRVTDITCGDPGSIDTVPVNVEIIHPSAPSRPNIIGVHATYSSTSLDSVTVTWRKLLVECPVYELSLTYTAFLAGSDPVEVSCETVSCSANLEVSSTDTISEYELTLFAWNNVGTSASEPYPIRIERFSGQYITPVLNNSNCVTTVQCVSSETLLNIATCTCCMCSVQYTTNSQYEELSDPIMFPLNTTYQLPTLNSGTTYYFVFTVPVTSTFLIQEQVEFTTKSNIVCTSTLDVGSQIGVTFVMTLVLSVVIGLAIGMLLMYYILKNKVSQTQPPLSALPPQPPRQTSPAYEDVSALTRENIELKPNEAYTPVRN